MPEGDLPAALDYPVWRTRNTGRRQPEQPVFAAIIGFHRLNDCHPSVAIAIYRTERLDLRSSQRFAVTIVNTSRDRGSGGHDKLNACCLLAIHDFQRNSRPCCGTLTVLGWDIT